MNEKEKIEEATADAFLEHYNSAMGTSYVVVDYSDAPDVRCKDEKNNKLNLEITLTEDHPGDIQGILGRSNKKSHKTLRENLNKVKSGEASIFDSISCLSENVKLSLIQRIMAKSKKDYGTCVALIIRDSSPVGWDWDLVKTEINEAVKLEQLPFDKGVWIVTYTKDRIIQLV